MNLGVPTPYLRIAFPQTQSKAIDYLDMQNLSTAEQERWSERFTWFLKALTFHQQGKQLVLKSPPHTGRIEVLAKLFPQAKFIHLTRDPRKLFSSTLRLWRSLDEVQALQKPADNSQLTEYVTECLNRMYQGFERAKSQVAPERIAEIRYEDLVANPLGSMQGLYEQLQLGDFSEVAPQLEKRLANHGDYRPNTHKIDETLEREILERWSSYAEKYGYQAVNR